MLIISHTRRLPIVDSQLHLSHASVGSISYNVPLAILEWAEVQLRDVNRAWDRSRPSYQTGREFAAKLVNSQADNIAYSQNTLMGISKMVYHLPMLRSA